GVARPELPCRLCRQFLVVQEVPPGRAVLAPIRPARPAGAPLAEDREAAVLEHAQLADDAVAAAVRARSAGANAQTPLLDAERIRELERLDGSRERVRHRHVHPARPVRVGTRALAAADRLVVGEPLVA